MSAESKISLDCPYCGAAICQPLGWFKKSYSTCPACDQGLAAGQFAAVIANLEQAMDENLEEMIHGRPHGGCCGDSCSCGSDQPSAEETGKSK